MLQTLAIAMLLAANPGEVTAGKAEAKPAPGTPVLIQLKDEAICRGINIQLRDVARIITTDDKLKGRLRQLDLGIPPSPGYIRKVTPFLVRRSLKKAGLTLPALKIAGADRTVVESRCFRVEAAQINAAAVRVLKAVIRNIPKEDIRFSLVGRPNHQVVPAGRLGVDLTARLRGGKIGRNHALVDVSIMVDGEEAAKVGVSFTLARMKEVLVALTTIRKGEPLTGENTGLVRVDTTSLAAAPVVDLKQIKGKVALRTLYNKRPITMLDVKDPDLVHKGDQVTMVGRRGSVTITMKGVAVSSGALGDRIKVTNLSSKRAVMGRVAGRGVVEIF